jgi:2-keto-3-deoxy-L-rhamnonate aldolase RhmA
VIVGPNDLAISHAGTNEGAGVAEGEVAMITKIAEGCRQRGLAAGISCSDGADARRWQAAGYTLLGLPSDAGLLGSAMSEVLADARREES